MSVQSLESSTYIVHSKFHVTDHVRLATRKGVVAALHLALEGSCAGPNDMTPYSVLLQVLFDNDAYRISFQTKSLLS